MCLLTNQKVPLINRSSIKAYKVLVKKPGNLYLSLFYEFNYTEYINNKCIISGPIPHIIMNSEVDEGFHLFLDLKDANIMAQSLIELYTSELYSVGLYEEGEIVVFECEIPSESYYFIGNKEKEICTNQFRFIKEIKI